MLLLGLNAFQSMPRLEDPEVNFSSVITRVVYPGASPQDIERQIIDVLEKELKKLDDIDELVSTSLNSAGVIRTEFEYGATTPADALEDVVAAVNAVKDDLPDEVTEIENFNFTTSSVAIFLLALHSETASNERIHEYAELLVEELELIDGVTELEIQGYPDEEVTVALSPVKMTQMNIGLQDIENAIRSTNANVPAGNIDIAGRSFGIKTSGNYRDLEEIRNTIVGSNQGKIVYLKNIADVQLGYKDDKWQTRLNGQPCLFIKAEQTGGLNILDLAPKFKSAIASVPKPRDIQLDYVFDQSLSVEKGVGIFQSNLLQGIALVGIIVFIILGVRSSILVIISIPLSILIGLFVVNIYQLGIQQMSIVGMVISLGLLVDNSIVIVENIERFMSMGYSKRAAAIKGTQQLMGPVVSATLTTIFAFIPIALMPDETGDFIRSMPISVVATLIASLAIAVTLTPLLAIYFLKEPKDGGDPSVESKGFFLRGVQRLIDGPYTRLIKWVLRHRGLVVGIGLVAFVGSVFVAMNTPLIFFPKSDKPMFTITIDMPKGTNIDVTNEAAKFVEATLDTMPEIAKYATNVGNGNARVYYNIEGGGKRESHAGILVFTHEYDGTEFPKMIDRLRAKFDQYSYGDIAVKVLLQGPPSEGDIAIAIEGKDLKVLEKHAGRLENILSTHPAPINILNPFKYKTTDLYFNINKEKALLLGVPIFSIDKAIRSYLSGAEVSTFKDIEGEEYDIVLKYDYDEKFELSDFEKINVRSVTGRFIPLKQITNIEFREGLNDITHNDARRYTLISADLKQGYDLATVVDEVVEEVNSELPKGYRTFVLGELANREKSFGGLGIASMIAMLLILGVLIVQFRSFIQPLIIFSSLPLAFIGSMLLIYISGYAYSFTALVGLVSLIGISINNSIVLVDFANESMDEGKTKFEAALLAGKTRLLPIVMTTLTTILGLLPLTLSGSPLWAPMGIVIIGGLISSTIFILILGPIFYTWFTNSDRAERIRNAQARLEI